MQKIGQNVRKREKEKEREGGVVKIDGKRLMGEEKENERKKLSNNKPGSAAEGKLSFRLNPALRTTCSIPLINT